MGGWTPLPDYAQPKARNVAPTPPASTGGWVPLPLEQQTIMQPSGGWTPLGTQPALEEHPSFGALLKGGAAQIGQAAGGLLEAFGPTTGMQQTGQQIRESQTKEMTPVMSLEQLGSGYDKVNWSDPVGVASWLGSTLSNLPRYTYENVANQIPNMALSGAAGYGGAAIGGMLGGPPGAAAGLLAGSFVSSYFLNAGETYAGLREKGVSNEAAATTAGFVGAAKGVLDTALPAKLFGSLAAKTGMKIFWVPKDMAAKAPALWKAVASGIGIEGGTEAGQELLDMWAEQQHGVYTPGGGLSRVLNSAAAGAAGGGVFSAGEHFAGKVLERGEEAKAPLSDFNEAPPDTPTAGTPVPPAIPRDIPPEAVPAAIKDKVLELGGQDALFRSFPEDEMKKILEVDPKRPLQPALDKGLIVKDGENYRLAEHITGAMPMEPVPEIPGMSKSVGDMTPQFQYTSQVDPTKQFKIDYTPLDPETGTGDQFKTTVGGQVVEGDSLAELSAKIDEGMAKPGTEEQVAQDLAPPHTQEELDTISRLFPTASITAGKDNDIIVSGRDGIVMRKPPNGPIVITGGKTETRPGYAASGVTRVLTPQYAAYLGGLRGTEVQVDPSVGADRQTLLHEFGWHTFLELGATEEQRAQAKALFPDEEDGATALAQYLDGTWTARDQARSKLLFDITQWFKNLYHTFMGNPEALFNQAGSGDWVHNQPSAPRTLGERYEMKEQAHLEKTNTFFDQLERVVDTKMPNVASAAQVRGILANQQSGVKAEQLRWTGIDEWLKAKGMNRVTKEEVLDQVRMNSVRMKEVTKQSTADAMREQERVSELLLDLDEAYASSEMTQDQYVAKREELDARMVTPSKVDPTKFSSLVIPEGEGYKEMLFTLPEKTSWLVYDNGGRIVHENLTEAQAQEYALAKYGWSAEPDVSARGNNYESTHWDELNVLAHTRFNIRQINGKNTLFVEEIQSDWQQALRKAALKAISPEDQAIKAAMDEQVRNKVPLTQAQNEWWRKTLEAAYDRVTAKGDTTKEIEGLRQRKANLDNLIGETRAIAMRAGIGTPEYTQAAERIKLLRRHYQNTVDQINELESFGRNSQLPDAPMRYNWHEMVFKRMLRYAAEHGFDQIAWTDGKTQNERYSLSKHIDTLVYNSRLEELTGFKNGERKISESYKPSDLPGAIGEELAAKLLNTPVEPVSGYQYLRGQDLEVGGSGMKGFYDKILVDYANKYGKKWGAQVRDSEIEYQKTNQRTIYTGPDYNYSTFRDWIEDHVEELQDQMVYMEATRVLGALRNRVFSDAMQSHGSQDLARMLGGNIAVPNNKETATVHTMPITAAMKHSVLYEGQALFEKKPVPTPVPASDRQGTKEMKQVNKLIRNVDSEGKFKIQDALGRTYKYLRHTLTLTQIQDQNPNNPYIKEHVDQLRLNKRIKNEIQLKADEVSRVWMKPGIKNVKKISELLRLVNEKSERLDRRLMDTEVAELAAPLGGPSAKIIEAWRTVDKSMQDALQTLRESLIKEARRAHGLDAAGEIKRINDSMDAMAKTNYFPATRFGEWGVLVKATGQFVYKGRLYGKGSTVQFETREAERHGLALRDELTKQFPSDKVEVLLRKLTPTEQSFINMPESLADYLKAHMDLTDEQFVQLKDIQRALSPGAGIVKHMIRKQGVLGASTDGLRVYNDYFRSLSGHIARLETSADIERNLADAKAAARLDQRNYNAQLTAEILEQSYKDSADIGNEWGAVAGGMFHLVFSFNPMAAVVNMTQVPMLTYPYLAKNSNDIVATKAIATATAKVGKMMLKATAKELTPGVDSMTNAQKNAQYTGEDKQFFDRAVDEGYLKESVAGSISALANSSMLGKFYEGGVQLGQQLRWLMSKSIVFFEAAEEFNRRVTLQAAIEVGRTKGLTGENLYQFARKAVDMTQFELARWNRPKFMKGKAGVLFIFKSYLQNFLYFAATNQGGVRFWLMLVAMAGLKGVPGADDMLDMVEMLGTWGKNFFGMKNPKVDAEKMARDYIKEVGANPDLVMNGLSRYSFGLAGLNTLFGIPFPAADFSSSMQMTRLVPGMRMVKGMNDGTMKWGDAFLTAFQDVTGVAGSTGANFTRAVLEDSPAGGSRLLAIPAVLRNMSKAADMATHGAYRDSDGTTLVDVDLTKPEHLGELVMQALGKRPTRVTSKLESRYMDKEMIGYYMARRDTIIQHWAEALGSQDKEAADTARKEYVKFNQTSPPEFLMPSSQLRGELHKLLNKRGLKEMGLPSNKKFIGLAQGTSALYQSPF